MTGTIATFFIERDASDADTNLASRKSIYDLRLEIAASELASAQPVSPG